MVDRPDLERLYVHESVENVVPTDAFVDAVSDAPLSVTLVGDGEAYDRTDAVATYVPRPEFLDAGWVHCIRAGYDEFETDAYERVGVPFTNSTGIHGSTVSELALDHMLSFARLGHRYRDHQNRREWMDPPYERPFTLENERVCVVGLGTIGEATATRCDALGMEVVGVRRSETSVPGVSELFGPDEFHDAIANARFVVLTVPQTPETTNLVSEPEFELMRDDSYLINVARGAIVDESALISALETGEIAGAGLDVFETEPLPTESPLWDFEEVIISPHKGSATNRYHLDLADLFKENVRRYQSAEPLRNCIV
jgi:D-2-hydroxyacid dehydrogenase (NADP+)